MNIFKKSEFLKLADIQNTHCVSMYLPTHRVTTPDNQYKDNTRLKNRLKEAVGQLTGFGMTDEQAKDYLKRGYDLLAREEFWANLSDGLVVFIHDDQLQYFTLPFKFDEYTYVSNHFYLEPLVAFLHGEGRHFIMALSLNEVRFFEATENTIVEVVTEGLIPEALVEEVGTDYEQRRLQYRTGQGGNGGLFTGHGAGNENERKAEALKFFRAVDSGLMEMLHDENAPLVIGCVDYLFPIYKEANTYPYLHSDHISGNHERTDVSVLKEMAWEIVKDQFAKEKSEAEKKYELLLSNGKAAFNPEEVIPAAIIGQAETLFIKRGEHLWGTYDPDTNKVKIDDMHRIGNTDLLNKAAVETVKKGGNVYIMDDNEMPDHMSPANAIFRFQM